MWASLEQNQQGFAYSKHFQFRTDDKYRVCPLCDQWQFICGFVAKNTKDFRRQLEKCCLHGITPQNRLRGESDERTVKEMAQLPKMSYDDVHMVFFLWRRHAVSPSAISSYFLVRFKKKEPTLDRVDLYKLWYLIASPTPPLLSFSSLSLCKIPSS